MPFGQGTFLVDGQRTTLPPAAAFTPPSYGVQTTGVPNMTPSIPPYLSGTATGSPGAGASTVNGYGTADNNAMVAQIAGNNPHNWRVSPTWWAVGCLVGGVLLLHVVSFREAVDNAGGKITAEAKAED